MRAGRRSSLRGLRVAVLGSGRAGSAFAEALSRNEAAVVRWSRRGARTPARAAKGCDLVLICVRDDAIREVAETLARGWRELPDGPRSRPGVALHTSGFHGSAPLRALARAGFAVGSIHPLVPLAGRRSAPDLEGAWFATSATGRARTMARRIVAGLHGRELAIPGGDRRKHAWHLACALVANGSVALFDAALEHAGRRAAPALAGMLGTVARRLADGPRAALSGPVARGEVEVVAGHVARLRTQDDARLYGALARRLLALSDLPPERRRAVARLLR